MVVRLLFLLMLALGLAVPRAPAEAGQDEIDLLIDVSMRDFSFTPGGVFIPGYTLSDTPGAPELPFYTTTVELPYAGEWSITYKAPGTHILSQPHSVDAVPVPDLHLDGPLSLQRREDIPGSVPTLSWQNPAIYRSDAFYPASPVMPGAEGCQRGRRLLPVRIFPFQYNPVTQKLLFHPQVTVTVHLNAGQLSRCFIPAASRLPSTTAGTLLEDAVVRVRTSTQGMHRLTYVDLQEAGVPAETVNPASFKLTLAGQPVQIEVTGSDDGRFDPGDLIVFYAEPYHGRWSATNVYQLHYGSVAVGPEFRIGQRSTVKTGAEPVLSTVMQTVHVERNANYYSNYPLSLEDDHFFDSPLEPTSSQPVATTRPYYDLSLDDPVSTGIVTVTGQVYGGVEQQGAVDQSFELWLNGHSLGLQQWKGRIGRRFSTTTSAANLLNSGNELHLVAALSQLSGISDYYIYPDWFDVAYPALAEVETNRLSTVGLDTTETSVQLHVTGFSTPDIRAYDVRNPRAAIRLATVEAAWSDSSYSVDVWDSWEQSLAAPPLEITTTAALLCPDAVEPDEPSHWKSPANAYDYIAIVHSSLAAAIEPLLQRRAGQGLRVAKVDLQDIYDEFNYGLPHQQAIRDFLDYAYHNWNAGEAPPRYVLLVGDGTYDPKNEFNSPVPNLVPPFLIDIDPWLGETAADNRYVSVDSPGDYLPDMSIGRIPAWTPAEVASVVEKIAAYEDEGGLPDQPWQNRVVFVADDDQNSAGNFHDLSDEVRLNWLPSYYQSPTIYFNPDGNPAGAGYTTAADMKSTIKQAFDDGALMIQWFGHASRFRWGSVDRLWKVWDPPALNSNGHLPFVASYSCWTGYFVNLFGYTSGMPPGGSPHYQALGETQLLERGRGAIADFSSSGEHVGSALALLDEGLINAIFRDRIASVGDAVNAAKLSYYERASVWLDILDTSILFGDPALKLRLPLPAPIAPVISIAVGTTASVELTWLHSAADTSYEIWRGTTPYFSPTADGVQVGRVDADAANLAAGSTVTFTLEGVTSHSGTVVGDAELGYFWVVRGLNWRGSSGASNQAGEFAYSLAPGVSP